MSDITHVGMYVRMYVYVYTYVYCYLKLFHSDTLPSDGTYMYMYMYMYVKFTYIIRTVGVKKKVSVLLSSST